MSGSLGTIGAPRSSIAQLHDDFTVPIGSIVVPFWGSYIQSYIVEARKLEHGFRRISARIPYTLS